MYKYPFNPVMGIDPLGLEIVVNGEPADYNTAITYLKKDSGMVAIISDLEKSSTIYTVEYFEGNGSFYNSNNNTILWNPHIAVNCITKGGTLSPALALGHELAHADKSWLDKSLRSILSDSFFGDYGNYEEWRVITGAERDAAKTLGESIRYDRFGRPLIVPSPVSRKSQ